MMPSPPQSGPGAPPPQQGSPGMMTPPGPRPMGGFGVPPLGGSGPGALGPGGPPQGGPPGGMSGMGGPGGPGGPMPGGLEQQGYMDQFRQFLQFLFGSGALQNAAKQGGPAAIPSPSASPGGYDALRLAAEEGAKRHRERQAAAAGQAGKGAKSVDQAVRKILTGKKK